MTTWSSSMTPNPYKKTQNPSFNSKLFASNEHLKVSFLIFTFGSFLVQFGIKLVDFGIKLTTTRRRIHWDHIQLLIVKNWVHNEWFSNFALYWWSGIFIQQFWRQPTRLDVHNIQLRNCSKRSPPLYKNKFCNFKQMTI